MRQLIILIALTLLYQTSYGYQDIPILFETKEMLKKNNAITDFPLIDKEEIKLNKNVLELASLSEINSFRFKIGEIEYLIDVKKIKQNKIGGQSIVGTVKNQEFSTFIISYHKGNVAGHFYDNKNEILYELTFDFNLNIGQINLVTNEGKKPGSEPLEMPNLPKKDFDLDKWDDLADENDNSVVKINILAVYTDQAEAWVKENNYGSIDAYATQMISLSQSYFDNSNIYIEYDLVHSYKVNYSEKSASTDLERLTAVNDGHMDEIHSLRDEYGADVVVFYSYGFDTGGLAWLLKEPNGWSEYAFALTRVNVSYPNATAHEIGHSIGAHHSRNQNSSPAGADGGLFDYSTGWRLTGSDDKVYVTVMGYEEGVSTYIPYFSNPDVSYLGTPTGSYTGSYAPADNARSLNQIRYIAANYRQGNDEFIPNLLSPENNSEDISQNVTLKWNSISTADSYIVQISNDDFTSILYENVVKDTVAVATLGSESTYSWRVAAITSGNQGSWSQVWTFSTSKAMIGFVEEKNIVLSDYSGPETEPFVSNLSMQDISALDSIYAIEFEFDLSNTTNVKLDSITTNLPSSNMESWINEGVLKLSLIVNTPISSGDNLFTFHWTPKTFGNSVFTLNRIQLNNSIMTQIDNASFELFQVLVGDVDGDLDVDSYDAASVLSYSVGTNLLSAIDPGEWELSRMKQADVDGDGVLLALDASYIQQYIVGLIDTFPTTLNNTGDIFVHWVGKELRFTASDSLLGFNLEIKNDALSIKEVSIDWESNNLAINKNQGYRLGISSTKPIMGEFLALPIENTWIENREIELVMYSNGKKTIKQVTIPGLVKSELTDNIPVEFLLFQNFPNPFNPVTQIQYSLPISTEVRIEIYNSVGQLVEFLVNEQQPAGYYTISFDASGLSSGIYFYKLITPSFIQSKKMLLIK